MRSALVLAAALLLTTGCNRSGPPSAGTESTTTELEARTVEHLQRLYREAREGAAPSRETLVELLGIDPRAERSRPIVSSRPPIPDGDLRIEPLTYLAAPRIPVSALLWRPPGEGPFPAVLMTHGHFEGGKSAPAVQARCRDLARAGIAVLAIDLFGHGERMSLGHANAAELYLAGTSLLALDVQSLVRGLDVLAARPDIDASRLGFAGQSGGAIAAIHAAAIDERALATFANSGLHDWKQAVLTVPQCSCNYAPDQLRLGTVADAAALVAPRALLTCHGRDDEYIPLASARAAHDGQSFVLEVRGGGHEFNEQARLEQLGFFGRAFSLASEPSPVDSQAPDALGLTAFGAAGPPDDAFNLSSIAAERQEALRPTEPLPPAELRARLRDVLALPSPAPAAELREGRLVLETEPGLELQGWLGGADQGRVILILDPRGGRTALIGDYARSFEHPSSTIRVLAVDLRGQGDSVGGKWDYLQLHVGAAAGAPLLGRRVHDLRGWLAAARALAGDEAVLIHATGEAALITVLLGALDPEGFPSIAPVLNDLPATLFVPPGSKRSFWLLPASFAVAGLAELGDVSDFFAALPPTDRSGATKATVGSLRARDGRPVPVPHPHWRRFREAGATTVPRAEGLDPE